jgi:cobalt/nickel transport system permease protein
MSLVLAMHIPDGFLSGQVAAAAAVLAALAVGIALRVADRTLDETRVPLLGVLAAFIFAAQMLNFPVAGGTSGHFLGATLAAVLLGPWAACLVMAVVVTTQAFAFADGGVAALGANVLNMGVIGALMAGLVVTGVLRVARPGRTAYLAGVAVVAWLAVMLGATATSLELAWSGTVPLHTVLPAMLGVHALIGVGEALITVVAVSGILAARPDLVALGGDRYAPAATVPGVARPATGTTARTTT